MMDVNSKRILRAMPAQAAPYPDKVNREFSFQGLPPFTVVNDPAATSLSTIQQQQTSKLATFFGQ